MIEKRITEAMLQGASLHLTERDVDDLDLPEHSGQVALLFEGEEISARWEASGRKIGGEVFGERLQEYGQISGLIRVRQNSERWEVTVVAPQMPGIRRPDQTRPAPVTATTQPAKKKIKRRSTAERKFHADSDFEWSEDGLVGFLREAQARMLARFRSGDFNPLGTVLLRMGGEVLASIDGYEEVPKVGLAT